jgi:hypothetical protein
MSKFLGTKEALDDLQVWPVITKVEDVVPYIQNCIQQGSDYIKVFYESGKAYGWELPIPSVELLTAIIEEAHRNSLKVIAHAQIMEETITVLECGADGLAHTFCDVPTTPALIEAYKLRNAWCCPTLAATSVYTVEDRDRLDKFNRDPRIVDIVGEDESKRLCTCIGGFLGRAKLEYAVDSVRQLHGAGIDIVWYVSSYTLLLTFTNSRIAVVTLLELKSQVLVGELHTTRSFSYSCTALV